MPYIQLEIAQATKEQKAKLIRELTETAGKILGINEAAFYVLIKENSLDNWGVGGNMLSEAIKR